MAVDAPKHRGGPQSGVGFGRKRIVENQVGGGRNFEVREEITVVERPLDQAGGIHPALFAQHHVGRRMAQVGKRRGVAGGQGERIEVALETHDVQRAQRVGAEGSRLLLGAAQGRHGVGRRAEADVPNHQRLRVVGRAATQTFGQAGLGNIEPVSLHLGGRHRVHDLARTQLADTGKRPAVGAVNIVVAQRGNGRRAGRRRMKGRVGLVVAVELVAFDFVVGDKGAVENGGAHLRHQPVVKGDVVVGEELPAEGFVALDQMMDVGAGMAAAGRAIAAGVERFVGEFIDGAAEVDFTVGGERGAALSELPGDDAIEHVHAAMHRLQNVDRGAHAHQVTRQVFGQLGGDDPGELVALGIGFTDREPADGEAVEGQVAQVLGAAQAEIAVAGALDDTEKSLGRFAAGAQGAFGPAVGQIHGRQGGGVLGGRGDALVEHHHDVAADRALHADAGFGREMVKRAVYVAAKLRALLGHDPVLGQRKNLKPAGVGQHRAIPVHKPVNAAKFLKHLGAGTQEEVKGVGQETLGTEGAQAVGVHVFHRGLSAHRHKNRGAHFAMQGLKPGGAGAGAGGGFFELESEAGHSGEGARRAGKRRWRVRTVRAGKAEAMPKTISREIPRRRSDNRRRREPRVFFACLSLRSWLTLCPSCNP